MKGLDAQHSNVNLPIKWITFNKTFEGERHRRNQSSNVGLRVTVLEKKLGIYMNNWRHMVNSQGNTRRLRCCFLDMSNASQGQSKHKVATLVS